MLPICPHTDEDTLKLATDKTIATVERPSLRRGADRAHWKDGRWSRC
jgi:hypothetical protein